MTWIDLTVKRKMCYRNLADNKESRKFVTANLKDAALYGIDMFEWKKFLSPFSFYLLNCFPFQKK